MLPLLYIKKVADIEFIIKTIETYYTIFLFFKYLKLS